MPRSRQAAVDRLRRFGGDGDVLFALAAGVLFAMMLDHFQRRREELQLLADVAADFLAKFAAAGTDAFFVGQFVNHLPAGKVIGQRSSAVSFVLWLLPGFVFVSVTAGRS